MNVYRLFVPKQATGANTVYFDLFVPTTSQYRAELLSIMPIVSGEVAVVGTVGVDLFLTRTTAVGTGGTAATYEGTSLTAMTFSGHSGTQELSSAEITARLTPTGGATAGSVLSWRALYTEETNAGTYTPQFDMVRGLYADVEPIPVKAGTGIRVVQGGVASVGNIGFDVIFRLRSRP